MGISFHEKCFSVNVWKEKDSRQTDCEESRSLLIVDSDEKMCRVRTYLVHKKDLAEDREYTASALHADPGENRGSCFFKIGTMI